MTDEKPKPRLRSLPPREVFTVLDLNRPGLEPVRAALASGRQDRALVALLDYYRGRFPLPDRAPSISADTLAKADAVADNTLQFLTYAPRRYEEPIDWEWDPHLDIEWVAQAYRFNWAQPLAEAYASTGDDKYVSAFVRLAGDWIAKHPLESHEKAHRTLTHWRGFAWLDIQTGLRATMLCHVFRALVHGESFAPSFLATFLASLYDHQVKSELIPMGILHNKAQMELRGLMDIAHTFPEFADSPRLLRLGLERCVENFLGQVTSDGVQREWSFGYHMHVLGDAVKIMSIAEEAGIAIPGEARARAHLMYEFLFGFATPELGMPMFGDTRRELPEEVGRVERQEYQFLMEGSRSFGEPKYSALAKQDYSELPTQKSFAWSQAGLYAMRSAWGPDQIFFALHDSPPAISGHDQEDNGTFELYAFGRWLMNDTGYYTYGHDTKARAWHRQTSVHQTLTLNGENSRTLGAHRLWASEERFDALCADSAAYEGLTHRRTVWFVDRRFLVILDEAIGDAQGVLDLHFQFAPGPVALDVEGNRAYTLFRDANALVFLAAPSGAILQGEEGWHGWSYNKRVPRIACRFRLPDQGAPASALTVIAPYCGADVPTVEARLADGFFVGRDAVEATARVGGESWRVGRDLGGGKAWCVPL